jgi:hypothetical protein
MQISNLRNDGLDGSCGDGLDEVDPMHCDVDRRTRGRAPGGIEAPVVVGDEQQPVLQVRAARKVEVVRCRDMHDIHLRIRER